MIYLDYNATCPILPEVKQTMLSAMDRPYNASSVHALGREAKNIISKAKDNIRGKLGSESAEIIFTGTSTEASNLALKGLDKVKTIITTEVEHSAVLNTVKSFYHCEKQSDEAIQKSTQANKSLDRFANARDDRIYIIQVDSNGITKLDELDKALSKAESPALVSVQLANSETGVIQPIKEVVKIALKYGAYIHSDATAALGKVNINFDELGVDMISVAAHKIGGPQGVGALIHKKGLHFNALIQGGGQQGGYRSGTENIAGIVGFAKACELIETKAYNNISILRDELQYTLETKGWQVFGKESERLCNTLLVSDGKTPAETQLIKADLAGICISAGSACSSGKVTESYVLKAMGIDKIIAEGAIRLSLGVNTTKNEIKTFLTKLT